MIESDFTVPPADTSPDSVEAFDLRCRAYAAARRVRIDPARDAADMERAAKILAHGVRQGLSTLIVDAAKGYAHAAVAAGRTDLAEDLAAHDVTHPAAVAMVVAMASDRRFELRMGRIMREAYDSRDEERIRRATRDVELLYKERLHLGRPEDRATVKATASDPAP